MTYHCAHCHATLSAGGHRAGRALACPRCGRALTEPTESGSHSGGWDEAQPADLDQPVWEMITVPEPAPSPEQLDYFGQVVDLSAELPTLAMGCRAFDLTRADRTSAEAFLADLVASKAHAADCARRAVVLQREIDRYFDRLAYPPPPTMPPDLGIFNVGERNRVAAQRADARARQQADLKLHDQLGSMLSTMWEALAAHLAVVDRAILDIEQMLGTLSHPSAEERLA